MNEKILEQYLTSNHGKNLSRINSSLELVESQHIFKGGRIDILAKTPENLVGIELKTEPYNTRQICAQLMNYINYLSPKNGLLYFVAPKITYGTYSTLKVYYENNQLQFFEFAKIDSDYAFRKIPFKMLDDARKKQIIEYSTSTYENMENKLLKGIEISVQDKNKRNLIQSIINSHTSKQKQLENIAESLISIYFHKKNSYLKKAYDILKLL